MRIRTRISVLKLLHELDRQVPVPDPLAVVPRCEDGAHSVCLPFIPVREDIDADGDDDGRSREQDQDKDPRWNEYIEVRVQDTSSRDDEERGWD